MTDNTTEEFHDDLRAVAGEYVLDTLSVRERTAFEAVLAKDMSVMSLVEEWKRILAPVLESAPEEQPDQSVWLRVNESLEQSTPEQKTDSNQTVVDLDKFRRSRNRWRGLSAGMVSLAAGLAAFVVIDGSLLQPPSVVPDRLAVLTTDTAGLQFIATVDPARQGIHIRPLNQGGQGDPFAEGPLELWVQVGDALNYLGNVTSASWQWLNYADILKTEDFDQAVLLLARSQEQGATSPTAPGEIVFQGQISSRAK
ncbi:MAG: anti-sigma factor [Alphaproteobacteria bacterium]